MAALSNPRWEIFAQGIAAGSTAAESFRKAFPSSKAWKDSAVYPKASNLRKRKEIAGRIAELQKIAEDAAIADRTEIARLLTDMSRGTVSVGGLRQDDLFAGKAVVPVHVKDRISAIRTLAKLQGFDKPKPKQEDGEDVKAGLPPHLENLSDDELEAHIKNLGGN